LASSDKPDALTSFASVEPSKVVGHVVFAGVVPFDGMPWWDGFVLVTSRISASSVRRPVP
jgi:hypothetical protein